MLHISVKVIMGDHNKIGWGGVSIIIQRWTHLLFKG